MADKKAVVLEHLEIIKNYIDNKDAESIKSAEFVDDTLKFYTSEDKSGEAVAEIVLPEETFLDGSKTELVSDFFWSSTKYPKSTNPELDGKPVLVLAVKSGRTVRYSFISLGDVVKRLVGVDTDSTSVDVLDNVVSLTIKVSELQDNCVVMRDDGLFVGAVDNTPTWTVSTDEEVRELFPTGDEPTDKAGTLGAKNIGDIVKIKENGVDTNFIVVQKGLPSDMYDSSCDGVWIWRTDALTIPGTVIRGLNSNNQADFENSETLEKLNNQYLNIIDENVREVIKEVKIPFKKGVGTDASQPVKSGADGLPCKVFLLSAAELGCTDANLIIDGVELDYTPLVKDVGSAIRYLRTPTRLYSNRYYSYGGNPLNFSGINADGYYSNNGAIAPWRIFPAFILSYSTPVDSDGVVMP